MSFSKRLRERREALGLKQSELGKLIGVTGAAVANYENGYSSPKADVLYRVFDALQCDANYLFQDEFADTDELRYSIKETKLVDKFRQFNEEGQDKVLEYMDDLYHSGKYIKTRKADLDTKVST